MDSLGDRICIAVQREAEVIEGLRSIDKTTPKALTDSTSLWEEDNGFVYYKGKLYVPNDRVLRRDVVKSCHDSVTTGHPGKNETIELVSCYYWWPHMGGFITAYVEGCNKCQRYRRDTHPKALMLHHGRDIHLMRVKSCLPGHWVLITSTKSEEDLDSS